MYQIAILNWIARLHGSCSCQEIFTHNLPLKPKLVSMKWICIAQCHALNQLSKMHFSTHPCWRWHEPKVPKLLQKPTAWKQPLQWKNVSGDAIWNRLVLKSLPKIALILQCITPKIPRLSSLGKSLNLLFLICSLTCGPLPKFHWF